MRFCKQAMLERLYQERDVLERDWGFDPRNGRVQVLNTFAGQNELIQFGRFEMLTDLIEDLES